MDKTLKILTAICSIIVITTFFFCSENEDEKIIPKEEFIKIVTDLHYIDAMISTKGYSGKNFKDTVLSYYDYILKKYNVTRKGFDNSLEYYSNDLEGFLAIYDEVLKEIGNRTPKVLDSKSIYKIFDLLNEETRMKLDPDTYLGPLGRVIWTENSSFLISQKDTLKKVTFEGKLKFQCLILLQSSIMVYPEDSSKNLRMMIKVNYKDSTSDKVEKQITGKRDQWNDFHLFFRTDSTKCPKSIECSAFLFDSLAGKRHAMIKSIILKQFGPKKDTTGIILPTEKPNLPKVNKKRTSKGKQIK